MQPNEQPCKYGHTTGRWAPSANGKIGRCKECARISGRAFNAKYPEKMKAHNVKRRADGAKLERDRTKCREYMRKRNHDDPRYFLLSGAKCRAKRDNAPCNITVDDIVVPARCPVLLIPIVRGEGKPVAGSPSLDKLIPELGYVRGNIAVISHKANSMKQAGTPEELQAVANYVRQQYPQWLLTS